MRHRKQRCTNCGYDVLPHEESADHCPVCSHRDWLSYCEERRVTFTTSHCPWCSYTFLDREYRDAPSLAQALVSAWTSALEVIRKNPPHYWVRHVLNVPAQAEILQQITTDPSLNDELSLSLTVAVLDPTLPLMLHGKECNRATLLQNADLALELVSSPFPRYCMAAEVHPWLVQLENDWHATDETLQRCLPAMVSRPPLASALAWVLGGRTKANMEEALVAGIMTVSLRADEFFSSTSNRAVLHRDCLAKFPYPPRLAASPNVERIGAQVTSVPHRPKVVSELRIASPRIADPPTQVPTATAFPTIIDRATMLRDSLPELPTRAHKSEFRAFARNHITERKLFIFRYACVLFRIARQFAPFSIMLP
jgi:hypothetical protein